MTGQPTEIRSIVDRLEKLERQNRRLRRIGGLIILSVAGVFLMAQARPSRTLEANEFILRDSHGKERAALKTVGGEPSVNFYGELQVRFCDVGGPCRLELTAHRENASITLAESSGTARAVISISGPRTLAVLLDKNGKVIWRAP